VSERLVWFGSRSMTGISDVWRAHPTAKVPRAAGLAENQTPWRNG